MYCKGPHSHCVLHERITVDVAMVFFRVVECSIFHSCVYVHSYVCPALQEILYVWNGFRFLARNPGLLRNMMTYVWKELMRIEESKGNTKTTDSTHTRTQTGNMIRTLKP